MKKNFSELTSLVIGDLMLDIYVHDNEGRESPEKNIPLIFEKNLNYYPGGAGNVIKNIKTMKGNVIPVGVIGKDMAGKKLKDIFRNDQIDISNIIESSDVNTTTKKRIYINGNQYLRIDNDSNFSNKDIQSKIYSNVEKNISSSDIVILSDYEKCVLTEDLCIKIINLAKEKNVKVIIDPKKNNIHCYSGAYAITPNFKEAMKISHLSNLQEMILYFQKVIVENEIKYVLLKNGDMGMTLIKKNSFKHFEAEKVEKPDVAGAGDTVISTFSLLLAAGNDIDNCVKYSNIAASLVVSKNETASIEIDEVFYQRSSNE